MSFTSRLFKKVGGQREHDPNNAPQSAYYPPPPVSPYQQLAPAQFAPPPTNLAPTLPSPPLCHRGSGRLRSNPPQWSLTHLNRYNLMMRWPNRDGSPMSRLLRTLDNRRLNHRQYRLCCNHQRPHNTRLNLSPWASPRVSDQQDESPPRSEKYCL